MNKILVTIYVLALNKSFDLFLPSTMLMSEALTLIQNTIKEMTDDIYEINPSPILYNEFDGKLINLNNIVKLSGLKNGCKVLLK